MAIDFISDIHGGLHSDDNESGLTAQEIEQFTLLIFPPKVMIYCCHRQIQAWLICRYLFKLDKSFILYLNRQCTEVYCCFGIDCVL